MAKQKQLDILWELLPPYVFYKGYKFGGELEGISNIFGSDNSPNDSLLTVARKDFMSAFGALNKTTFVVYGLAATVLTGFLFGTDSKLLLASAAILGALTPAGLFSAGSVAATNNYRKS